MYICIYKNVYESYISIHIYVFICSLHNVLEHLAGVRIREDFPGVRIKEQLSVVRTKEHLPYCDSLLCWWRRRFGGADTWIVFYGANTWKVFFGANTREMVPGVMNIYIHINKYIYNCT